MLINLNLYYNLFFVIEVWFYLLVYVVFFDNKISNIFIIKEILFYFCLIFYKFL